MSGSKGWQSHTARHRGWAGHRQRGRPDTEVLSRAGAGFRRVGTDGGRHSPAGSLAVWLDRARKSAGQSREAEAASLLAPLPVGLSNSRRTLQSRGLGTLSLATAPSSCKRNLSPSLSKDAVLGNTKAQLLKQQRSQEATTR